MVEPRTTVQSRLEPNRQLTKGTHQDILPHPRMLPKQLPLFSIRSNGPTHHRLSFFSDGVGREMPRGGLSPAEASTERALGTIGAVPVAPRLPAQDPERDRDLHRRSGRPWPFLFPRPPALFLAAPGRLGGRTCFVQKTRPKDGHSSRRRPESWRINTRDTSRSFSACVLYPCAMSLWRRCRHPCTPRPRE